MRPVYRVCALAIILIQIVGACPVMAQEQDAGAGSVKVTIAPYGWLMSVKGNVEAKGYTAHVKEGFGDLAHRVNYAGMLYLDVVIDDTVGFTGNINVAMLGDDGETRGVSLDGDTRMILSDVALFYRVGRTGLGGRPGSFATWDVLAGARIWDFKARVHVDHPYFDFTAKQHKTWVDPIVGGKAWLRFTDRWGMELRGDVGGFGAASEFTWSASSVLAYTIGDHGRLLAGYRGAGVNYENGSGSNRFRVDATLHGPIVGLAFQF